ncbi:MAG: class I SAM-dependent methyltransferase [Chloroflexi bacterium]|nr:class I SAM-dependent methyltransferase [Chloroflexota bacterium]MCI0577299.1 class I SAM-dependent methyltransferase [Chloroflexota bacterium]MCI0647743.1 class I SAM-dependent methyltransferase [Chloroflexota bacterium]MCI0731607.1 class I SAM-dependent methyltransferase [Chloroflexota bacterium]
MSQEDQLRWDEKWAATSQGPDRPHPLLAGHREWLTGGMALDVACGRGQNAIWLARQGYRVLGVDISLVGLTAARAEARRQGVARQTHFVQADLDNWPLPPAAFDLIVVFNFLDRRLLPAIRDGLRPGGLLFYATCHVGALQRKPDLNPAYLLRPGELAAVFAGWRILHDEEGQEQSHFVASSKVTVTSASDSHLAR